MNKTGS